MTSDIHPQERQGETARPTVPIDTLKGNRVSIRLRGVPTADFPSSRSLDGIFDGVIDLGTAHFFEFRVAGRRRLVQAEEVLEVVERGSAVPLSSPRPPTHPAMKRSQILAALAEGQPRIRSLNDLCRAVGGRRTTVAALTRELRAEGAIVVGADGVLLARTPSPPHQSEGRP